MNSITDDRLTAEIDKSLCRSRVYALLATGFGYPDRETYPGYVDGSFSEEMGLALDCCAPDIAHDFSEGLAPKLKIRFSYDEFAATFLRAFETDMPTPSAALNEGVHIFKTERPVLMLELKCFYRNFGLQINAEDNELVDTLTAELEFMQFLTAKQAQAEMEGLSPRAYEKAQRDFLDRHLCAWLPLVRAEIEKKVEEPFFLALATIADRLAKAHLEELRQATRI